MADHERTSTKHQRSTHIGQSRDLERSGLVMLSEDSHRFENRSDRGDSYHSHGSFRTSREELAPQQEYPQRNRGVDRRHHSQHEYTSDRSSHRYAEPEDRLSGSVSKDRRWTSHDRPKTINSNNPERFNSLDDAFYERESSNGHHKTNSNTGYTANERRRPIKEQGKYDRKDGPPDLRRIVREKRPHRDNEYDNYKHMEEEQEYQEAKSPARAHPYSSSDVTSLKVRYKDRGNTDGLDEQVEQYPSTADRQRHRHKHPRHNSSHGRPSSRGSSHSLYTVSDDSRDTDTPKEGSFPGRHLSRRDRRRSGSPSHSGSRHRSESRHRGRSRSRSSSRNDLSEKKYRGSSRSRKHSGKRKHKDRSASHDDRKRRKHKEREKETDKQISREKEKMKKRDEERRSVLTGKKIKLKVKKDKGDHERDANRKDLLQFLNSAFE